MVDEARLPTFAELFGREPETRAQAPGRVNLMGEHTDYNGGFVLPTVIPQTTRVELAVRDDRRVRVWTSARPEAAPETYELGAEARGRGWLDYVQGVTWALAEAGHVLRGVDVRIDSDVPLGAGLSSSAALEIALLRGLRAALSLTGLQDGDLARLGQRAENDLVGAPVGIMDQMAASLGRPGMALFLDTRTLAVEHVRLPPELEVVVIDSGVAHQHASGDYRTRRAECEQAATILGLPSLRELDVDGLAEAEARLPEVLRRRVRHVVTENARVLAMVTALRNGALGPLSALLAASHRSMRDDYEVSVPAVDALVDLARAEPDLVGARLTGGGFGGAVVGLAYAGRGAAAAGRIVESYRRIMPHPARVVVAGSAGVAASRGPGAEAPGAAR